MTTIGHFTAKESSFTGFVQTLSFSTSVTIEPLTKKSDKAPDYRLATGRTDIGVAWKKTTEDGATYLSVRIDDPSLREPISARLIPGEGDTHLLIWNRQ
jgi:uncharacterized protein (DUF736 family)